MPQFIVTVKRLNKRRVVPVNFPDRENIIGEVKEGFSFEGEEEATVPNPDLGKWFKDRDGHFYWGGGVMQLKVAGVELADTKSFQWFRDLKIENVWNIFNERGDNTTVAILDTGYDTENAELPVPLLAKLFVNNPSNTATIQDKVWHGTFCASLIASRNKVTNIGVAPLCKILIGKVSLKGELKDVNIVLDGIEWAIKSGADVISVSLGVPLNDQEQIDQLQDRLNQITRNKNVLIFAACGDSDSGQIISKEFYPASLDNCISVGTVKANLLDNITVRSNKTIIHTLGVDIDAFMLDNVIAKQSGTSMSAPIAAGVAALAISNIKKRNNGQWSKDEVLQKLIQTGNSIDGFADKKIINPLKFFQSL